jgi:hypothetical protein
MKWSPVSTIVMQADQPDVGPDAASSCLRGSQSPGAGSNCDLVLCVKCMAWYCRVPGLLTTLRMHVRCRQGCRQHKLTF